MAKRGPRRYRQNGEISPVSKLGRREATAPLLHSSTALCRADEILGARTTTILELSQPGNNGRSTVTPRCGTGDASNRVGRIDGRACYARDQLRSLDSTSPGGVRAGAEVVSFPSAGIYAKQKL
jgi:hypothetical protein